MKMLTEYWSTTTKEGGARPTNSRPCTTKGGDEEDDQGDELSTEKVVNTWVHTFQYLILFNFASVHILTVLYFTFFIWCMGLVL